MLHIYDGPIYFGRTDNVWITNGCFLKGLESWQNRVNSRNGDGGDGPVRINTL